MKNENILNAIGMINEEAVRDTKAYQRPKSRNWLKWGAMAACLCLVIVGSTIVLRQNFDTPGVDDEGGLGGVGEGTSYSVAVYPATENVENVASAEVVSLTESEALSNSLAEHLPKQLPDGFHYGRGSIYNTVMKDGTQYNMLRVEYISGVIPEQQFAEDGAAIAPDPETIGELFTVCVMNYAPKADEAILSSIEEVTLALLEENGVAYIRSGDCYIGVFTETADPATVLDALRSLFIVKEYGGNGS